MYDTERSTFIENRVKIKGTKEDVLNDPTFFTDTQTFDFGSLLLAGKDNKYVINSKTTLKLFNPTDLRPVVSENRATPLVFYTKFFSGKSNYQLDC